MLDLMTMRGFEVKVFRSGVELQTPNGYRYIVQQHPHLSDIACAFACFSSINTHFL